MENETNCYFNNHGEFENLNYYTQMIPFFQTMIR